MAENNYKRMPDYQPDAEIISIDDENICTLLGALKRIEAPNDFNFRVKARIANALTANRKTAFLPVFRYLLPLSAVLLIFGGIIFNSLYFAGVENAPTIAENGFQSPVKTKEIFEPALNDNHIAPVSPAASEKNAAYNLPQTAAVSVSDSKSKSASNGYRNVSGKFLNPVKSKVRPGEGISIEGGGSILSALTPPKKIITPPGINLEKPAVASSTFLKTNSLTPKEVLLQIGIESDYTGDKWNVSAVQENSPAKRSGVKIGDTVEAIDGEKLSNKPLQNKTIEGKKITVSRDGQKIEISLGIK